MILADKLGRADGSAQKLLQMIESPVPIVLVSSVEDFIFNEELLKLDKYILFNFMEFGWGFTWERGTPIFGNNIGRFQDKFRGDEWRKFDDFVSTNPPLLTFQRELLNKDVSDKIIPIEYPNWNKSIPPQTREQYNNRPISVFQFWGRSHEARLELHGNIWINATKKGYSVCDNIYFVNDFLARQEGEKWVTLWMPDYKRVEMDAILGINSISKLSVSLFGAGTKCFRTTGESPINSLMVMQDSNIAYSYKWEHGVNCIKFPTVNPDIEVLNKALERKDLYDLYLNCVATAEKYRTENYIANYIMPLINKYA